MKKLAAILLAAVMAFSLGACTAKNNNDENNQVEISNSVEILTKAWDLFEEDQKFMAMGGDRENPVENAPGEFNLENAEELGIENMLCFPVTELDKVDDVASLIHGMLSNNFTAGAYHVTDAADTDTVVSSIKDKITNNHWMCGFPEKFVIITVGDNYIISAYGLTEYVDELKNNISETYGESAVVVADEPLSV